MIISGRCEATAKSRRSHRPPHSGEVETLLVAPAGDEAEVNGMIMG